MTKIFSTFCATSLFWALAILYCFTSGSIQRAERDPLDGIYASAYAEPAHPVKLVRR